MAVQPPLAAGAVPPDPLLFGSFRSMNPRTLHFPTQSKSGQNPNATAASSSAKTVAMPSGFDNKHSCIRYDGRSFSEVIKPVVTNSTSKQDLHLFGKVKPHPGVRSSLRDGAKVISISSTVNHVLSEPFKWAVVGMFSHGVPKLNQIGKFFASLNLNGKFDMHWLTPRQVMVILGEESDFVRVWLGKIWQVAGFPMRVSKWSPSFDTRVESPIVPVWVRLPGLPAHFFDRGVLFEITSNVGKPIRVDSATAFRFKLSEARFCVELNLLLPRVDFLFLEFEGNMRKQRVVYENLPVFCSSCSHVGHGAEACYRTKHDLKPVEIVNVVKQPKGVDLCDASSALVVHSEVVVSAPSQKLELIKWALDNIHGALQPIFKWPVLDSGVMGFKISYEGAVLLSQLSSKCVISELEEGEINEDGDAVCETIQEEIGKGLLALDSVNVESLVGDAAGKSVVVVPEMVLHVNSFLAPHAPVLVDVDFGDIQHASGVGGSELMRSDIIVKSIVDVDVRHHGSACEFISALHVSNCVVVGGVVGHELSQCAAVEGDVMGESEVEVDVMNSGKESSSLNAGLEKDGPVPNSVGPDVFSQQNEPGRESDGPVIISKQNGPTSVSVGPAAIAQQNGIQSDRSVHTGKIKEATKTSKPFSLFKDKRQLDRMDGILKSGILRKPVRNVQASSHRAVSEAVKTPLQLAQEELAKGGAFHDFVISDSQNSKKFSNMNIMARRSWADEMEEEGF